MLLPLTLWAVVVALRPGDVPLARPGWWLLGGAAVLLVAGSAALASRWLVADARHGARAGGGGRRHGAGDARGAVQLWQPLPDRRLPGHRADGLAGSRPQRLCRVCRGATAGATALRITPLGAPPPVGLIRRRRLQRAQPALGQELLLDQLMAPFPLRRAGSEELHHLGPILFSTSAAATPRSRLSLVTAGADRTVSAHRRRRREDSAEAAAMRWRLPAAQTQRAAIFASRHPAWLACMQSSLVRGPRPPAHPPQGGIPRLANKYSAPVRSCPPSKVIVALTKTRKGVWATAQVAVTGPAWWFHAG